MEDDKKRGVSFLPDNWNKSNLIDYAYSFQENVIKYIDELKEGYSYDSCLYLFKISKFALDQINEGKPIPLDGLRKP